MTEEHQNQNPSQPMRRPIAPVQTQDQPAEVEPTAVSPAVEEQVVKPAQEEQPAVVPQEAFADPLANLTDEDWSKRIAEAKAAKEQQEKPLDPNWGKPSIVEQHTSAPAPNPDIEAEVERRVAEELKKREAAEPKKDEAPADEKKNAEDEQHKKEEQIAKDNNVSNTVYAVLGTREEMVEEFRKEYDNDPRDVDEKRKNPTPYEFALSMNERYGQRTENHMNMAQWIHDIKEKTPDAFQPVERDLRIAQVEPRIGTGKGPKLLSGKAAELAVDSLLIGMFRVHLYNSGFWLDLTVPPLKLLDTWYRAVDQQFDEVGRIIGGLSYVVHDSVLKQKFCDIFPKVVVNSNFNDYEDPDALLRNISFHDYDTILWAFCCMLYRDGIGAGIVCTNPDCHHIDNNQYINLANTCYVNTQAFPPEALKWMGEHANDSGEKLTEQDLIDYREKLLKFNKKVKCTLKEEIEFDLTVPTLKSYLAETSNLLGDIFKQTDGEKSLEEDSVVNQLNYHAYQMLVPWVRYMNIYKDGKFAYRIDSKESVYKTLEKTRLLDKSNFIPEVEEFIRDTKLTFYTATTLECPACHKKAELDKDNMFPLDMQYLFFCLCATDIGMGRISL